MKLNQEQQKIIKYNKDKNILILAGAGTGKTFTIIEKIKYNLINGSYSPSEILCITFTKKAANEIKERIKKATNCNIDVFTFHGFMYRLIKSVDKYSNISIYDEKDKLNILRKLIKKTELTIKLNDLSLFISNMKNGLIKHYRPIDIELFEQYNNELKKNNAIDFDDIQTIALNILPLVIDKIDKYKYVFVDEFQDTNKIQIDFIFQLKELTNCILTLVGDPRQSIYMWRGATIDNIDKILNDKNFDILSLSTNYRSNKNIIKLSNYLFKNKYPELVANNQVDEKIHFVHTYHDNIESNFIINEINKLVKNGCKYKDIAILSRVNSILKNLESYLIKNDIPYELVTNNKLFDNKEIKLIVAFLRLLINKFDLISFIYLKPETKIKRIGKKYIESKPDNMAIIDYLRLSNNKTVIEFINLYDELLSTKSLYDISIKIISYLNLLEKYQDNKNKLDNIDIFLKLVKDYTLEEFNDLFLDNNIDTADNNSVKLYTIHASKGLEFPIVFLIGLENGILPFNINNLKEERNILYVGLTRAKHKLYICMCENRTIYGLYNYKESQFVYDLNLYKENNYINYVRLNNNILL